MNEHTFGIKSFKSFLKMFCVIDFLNCGKGNSGMTSYENNLFAISSITRSTGTLVKRLAISKLTSFASFVGLSSLILLIKLEVEGKE